MYKDMHKAGFSIFGLHGFTGTTCHCEHEDCKDAGKHPLISGYKYSTVWSDEQLETMEELGHFDSGYGVLCKGLLVVDIDVRNGGDPAFLDQYKCGFVVATGSGDGSLHGYFKVPDGLSLRQHVDGIPGIDFKSSGYVVGPGSRHVKGIYKVVSGTPDAVGEAPQELLALLERDEFVRVEVDGDYVEYSNDELRDMLTFVSNDLEYDDYVKIGMALNHAGAPFELWDEWAQRSPKYTGRSIQKKWKSFGNQGGVTLGTLIHHARQGGWEESVTFTPTVFYDVAPVTLDDAGVDLLRPPGFVGDVAAWIESNNRRPREALAVAAALNAIGNVIGLRYTDDKDGVASNMFICCVSGAGTGKEAPQGCITQILKVAGLARAKSGNIKSEQEILRNLTLRSQACFLVIDELGYLLSKISNAQKSGSASYLEGIIAILMSAQGKANGVLSLSGDMFEALMGEFSKALAAENKLKSENEKYSQTKIDTLQTLINNLLTEGGIKDPFLSLIGFTTRVKFDESVTYESATNGFLRRSFVIIEPNDAPPMKKDFKPVPLPEWMAQDIMYLDSYNTTDRLQFTGEKTVIPSTPDALRLLNDASMQFDASAVSVEDGMESLYLGAYENVSRVSLILAAPGGLRTAEHVRWAYALTMKDIHFKRSLVQSNDDTNKGDAIVAKIRHYLELAEDGGLTLGVIYNKLKKCKRDNVDSALEWMHQNGALIRESFKPKRGKETILYKIKK